MQALENCNREGFDYRLMPLEPSHSPLLEDATALARDRAAARRGLASRWYVDPAARMIEHERLFAGEWAAIGVASDLAAPGALRPVEVNGVPLLAVRDEAGGVRVFHNVCSHRGLKLVEGPCSVQGLVRCRYHSWSYGLDGRLRATPSIGGPGIHRVEGFEKELHGLKPVRSTVWFDQIFVNIDGHARAFADLIAPLEARWHAFDPAAFRHGASDSYLRFELDCNWKLAVENYCEAYHLPWVHPGLNSYSRLEDHDNLIEPDRYAGQITRVYDPILAEDGSSLPSHPGLDEYWRHGAEYVALFPNLLLGIHRDHFFALRLEPQGVGRTVEHLHFYYLGEGAAGARFAALRAANARIWRQVFAEDVGVVEAMQRGRQSPAFDGGVFSPVMDTANHCFHRWAAARLG